MDVLVLLLLLLPGLGLGLLGASPSPRYEPNWPSLDTRPLPQWYDDAKIGVFMHWGVYSVPSFGSEWFWMNWSKGNKKYANFMKQNYPPNFTYQDFAPQFTAEHFDAKRWAKIIEKSGAKYVVITSKHHEGFTLWPSKYSYSWNAKDVGPHRDLVGELASAIRSSTKVRFGLYHSLFEWFNPLWLSDKKSGFKVREFVDKKIYPELMELVNNYRPEVLWSDGDWDTNSTYWRACEFIAWLYSDSPVKETVVTNDRWGTDTNCKHGDFFNCQDRFLPDVPPAKKWENAMTIDRESWGYRREAPLADYLTAKEVVALMAKTISLGGNFIMNIGPSREGTIPVIFEERLGQIGDWLATNGEAVYGTRPWKHSRDSLTPSVHYTQKEDKKILYAIVLNWPKDGVLYLGSPTLKLPNVTMLGHGALKVSVNDTVAITFPCKSEKRTDIGWALRITGLQSHD